MMGGGDYQMPSQMSSQSVEWISNRTGIDANRLQEMYQNGLRILSRSQYNNDISLEE